MTDTDNQPRETDRPVAVTFSEQMLHVTLADGRIIATPLAWYPRLEKASPDQRNHYELGYAGIHWPDLDEDLSVQGMLRGIHSPNKPHPTAQAKA